MTRTIEQTLDEIERFFERAAEVEGIATSAATRLAPTSDAAIDALAKKFDFTIPDDVRRFWRRGLNYKELSLRGDKPAFAGFDWYNLEYLARDMPDSRELAKVYEADEPGRRVLEKGIPLSYSSPQIIWDPGGGIVHFSTHNDLRPPIADSFTTFLEHWLEAGCHSSHAITRWLPKVQHLVPGRIPPEKNLWITYYTQEFVPYA